MQKQNVSASPLRAPKAESARFPVPKLPRSAYVVNPSFVPLPKMDLAELEALNRPCGSEDQLVPESEGETEQLGEDDAEESAPVKGLDLARFAFA